MQTIFTLRKLAVAALPLLMSGQVVALPPTGAEATVNTTARVIAPLQIQNTVGLSFGTIVAGDQDGIVYIDSTDGSVITENVQMINQGGNSPARANFQVSGEPNMVYLINLPPRPINLSSPSGGSLVLNDLFHESSGGIRTLSSEGADEFKLGAILLVAANSNSGSYTANFTVEVNYN